ncbi:MAG: hypothetical protein HC896_01365 [Bacteroidales bacterium]|nr:hypothetical protein [Bacteroidales bacterium]
MQAKKNTVEAKKKYQEASRLFPSEEYPNLQLQYIETTMGMLKFKEEQEKKMREKKKPHKPRVPNKKIMRWNC